MKLTKTQKILAGIATLIYAVGPFLMMGFMFGGMFLPLAINGPDYEPGPAFPMIIMGIVLPFQCLYMALHIGLAVFYLAHIIKNTTGSEVLRIILGAGNLIMPYLTMPVYYLIFILPEEIPIWALQAAPVEEEEEEDNEEA